LKADRTYPTLLI